MTPESGMGNDPRQFLWPPEYPWPDTTGIDPDDPDEELMNERVREYMQYIADDMGITIVEVKNLLIERLKRILGERTEDPNE